MKFETNTDIQETCQTKNVSPTITGTKSSRRTRRGESGSSLVETALVIPLFLIILGAIVDGGIVVQQYFMLHRIAYSASRLAVTTPSLSDGTHTSVNNSSHSHYELHQRIQSLVSSYGDDVAGNVTVTSQRVDDVQTVQENYGTSGNVGDNRDVTSSVIKIRVQINYPAFLGRFTGNWDYTVAAESEGPYLAVTSS